MAHGLSINRLGIVALALALTGCMSGGRTYGTGVPQGKQTIDDIFGLVTFSKQQPNIAYQARPGIVAPPVATLPPPGKADVVASGEAWPRDPDVVRAQIKAAGANRKPLRPGQLVADDDPSYMLPKPDKSDRHPPDLSIRAEDQAMIDAKHGEEAQKLIASVRANQAGGVDANGNPVRKTLTEPPVNYREPDPTAPTEFKTIKKKKKWFLFGGN
jgi:hypothetical protein